MLGKSKEVAELYNRIPQLLHNKDVNKNGNIQVVAYYETFLKDIYRTF